jgi:type I restriction enzyme M protein
MLDQDTKRRIDNARDILVGKVPDPKSQVEQITIALIYKFMDDIDKSSEELGGEPQFFTDDLKQYSWSKLLDSKLSGQKRLNIYTEAISKLGTHKNLPQLFRDIFKGALLPYRDPNVLHIFLKEINGFNYDHSENLGNAFEYLLSIMGSQGDAGQFRTSRHVIDFIVDVVDPKKDETVLDPACGTAGFLISAYKHILRQHDGKNDPKNKEKPLTPDEREKLMEHFVGYDISPDMVRLSLVNMYLHGFQGPKIFEYDTLGSEDRWDERYDVILANPPFMSPKGGVRPHRRFSVQANRTEVLFVDYIAEHLTSEGRAGIIVPEGIIFQAGTAYKSLRKMLVEEGGLYAVVSLPAGVFNPYSNVKTSILFLDKKFAKQAKSILFAKIQSDGFDLGAQRKTIENNDLPWARQLLDSYLHAAPGSGLEKTIKNEKDALLVGRDVIVERDYELTMERYRISPELLMGSVWPRKELGELAEFRGGLWKGKKPPFASANIVRNTNFTKTGFLNLDDVALHEVEVSQLKNRRLQAGDIILEKSGGGPTQPVGRVVLFENEIEGNWSFSNFTSLIRVIDETVIKPKYLWLWLNHLYKNGVTEKLQKQTSGIRNLDMNAYKELQIPIPPLEMQERIVEEINVKQDAIDSAKILISSLEREKRYFSRSIASLGGIEWVELSNICEINPKKSQVNRLKKETLVSFVPMADISQNRISLKLSHEKPLSDVIGSYTYLADNDVLLAKVTPCFENGKAAIARGLKNGIGFGSSELIVLRCSKRVLPEIIYAYIVSEEFREQGARHMTGTGGLQRVPTDFVKTYKVPLPSLENQRLFAAEINRLDEAIEVNSAVIVVYERKIKESMDSI